METLNVLKLSVPALDSKECKAIMGGDGYYDNGNVTDLKEVVITPNDDDSDFDPGFDPGFDPDLDDIYSWEEHDWDGDQDEQERDNDALPSIKDVIRQLPDVYKELLDKWYEKGLVKSIKFSTEIDSVAKIFMSKDGKFDIKISYEVGCELDAWMYARDLAHELFHHLQQDFGIREDAPKAAVEYQAYIADRLFDPDHSCHEKFDDKSESFDSWLNSAFDFNNLEVDYQYFMEHVSDWYLDFINAFPRYLEDKEGEDNYDWILDYEHIEDMDWEEILRALGFELK